MNLIGFFVLEFVGFALFRVVWFFGVWVVGVGCGEVFGVWGWSGL